ncbi:MAG TPA: hypothetical protein VJ836_02200 [Candidatus Saccharimonadales bacterium]|nr:hypothetical protein [Candidatus Saccharimonadales bacterium]
MALIACIFADIFSEIPTILKSYRAPHTEHATAYAISIVSMAVTLLTISDWKLTNWLFTAYILGVNVTIVLTITTLSKMRLSRWAPKRSGVLAYEEIESPTTRQ